MQTPSVPARGGGLRDRRRRETALEICLAALDLFEQKGVAGTTVDEIAARAGVSPRTVFRLAGSKEEAIFIDDDRFIAALEGVGRPGDDLPALLSALRAVFHEELRRLDADPRARERFLRVRRLITHEPSLLGTAIRREITSSDRFVPVLAERTGRPDLDVRAAAGLAGLEMRTTLDEWARSVERGETPSLESLHDEVQLRFTRAVRP